MLCCTYFINLGGITLYLQNISKNSTESNYKPFIQLPLVNILCNYNTVSYQKEEINFGTTLLTKSPFLQISSLFRSTAFFCFRIQSKILCCIQLACLLSRLQSVTTLKSFPVFHDHCTFEESWSVICSVSFSWALSDVFSE